MKKLINVLSLIVLLALFAMPASAKAPKESATATFTVQPNMTCANCENKIKTNLRYEKGVTDISTSLQGQTVTITYDPARTTPATLVLAFKKIGYTATQLSAPAETGECDDSHQCPSCPGHK